MTPPRTSAREGRCPRCGASSEPLQGYCLECGARLPETGGPRGGRLRPLLLLLAVAVAAAAAAAAASAVRDTSGPAAGPTSPPAGTGTGAPQTTAASLPTRTATTQTPAPSTATQTTEPPPATAPPRPPSPFAWPAGRRGYTVVLESIPDSAGRGRALARARAAQSAGLPHVGVLRSSAYASLRGGYWVVFTGVYGSRSRAEAALPAARASGFPDAYPARVAHSLQ